MTREEANALCDTLAAALPALEWGTTILWKGRVPMGAYGERGCTCVVVTHGDGTYVAEAGTFDRDHLVDGNGYSLFAFDPCPVTAVRAALRDHANALRAEAAAVDAALEDT